MKNSFIFTITLLANAALFGAAKSHQVKEFFVINNTESSITLCITDEKTKAATKINVSPQEFGIFPRYDTGFLFEGSLDREEPSAPLFVMNIGIAATIKGLILSSTRHNIQSASLTDRLNENLFLMTTTASCQEMLERLRDIKKPTLDQES